MFHFKKTGPILKSLKKMSYFDITGVMQLPLTVTVPFFRDLFETQQFH
jgi:hypothetical protein